MNTCYPETGTETQISGRKAARGKNQTPGFVNMGAALLLAVFLVITLVVFALLALSGAKNDLEFSRTLAEQKQEYYAACNQSEQILSQVEAAIRLAEEQGKAPDLSGLPVVAEENTVTWEIPVDENRTLRAACDLKTGEVTAWKTVPTGDWSEEQPIWNP